MIDRLMERASTMIRGKWYSKGVTLTTFLNSYIADCELGRRLHRRKKTRLADGTVNAFRNLRVALKDYEAQEKQGKDPTFTASGIGIPEEEENYWR